MHDACMHACIHTYIQTERQTEIHAYMHTCIHAYIDKCKHAHTRTHVQVIGCRLGCGVDMVCGLESGAPPPLPPSASVWGVRVWPAAGTRRSIGAPS